MSEHLAPKINRYIEYSFREGYIYIIIDNQDEEAIYKEGIEYEKFEHMAFIDKEGFETNERSFDITVGPNQTRIILIKAERGAEFSPGKNYKNVILGNKALEDLARNS